MMHYFSQHLKEVSPITIIMKEKAERYHHKNEEKEICVGVGIDASKVLSAS